MTELRQDAYLAVNRPVDGRWTNALNGLPVTVFVPTVSRSSEWSHKWSRPTPAVVTGMEGQFIDALVEGDTEPRRFFWCDVRPR